jgi:tetratricopeptide (TPR) repeat protein
MQPRGDAAPDPGRAAAIYNRALEVFKKALELTPTDFLARTGKLAALAEQAECYAAIQEYDLAIQNLSEAIQMKPNPRHLFRRGELYRQAGQRELARLDLTEYLHKGDDAEFKEQAQKYLNNLTPKAESAT